MEVRESILNRRSIRRFRPDLIPGELLMELLDAATWAPSHRNTQPWEFVVIGPDTRRRLVPILQKLMEEGPLKNPALPEERKQAARTFMEDFGGAPVLLAVTSQPATNPGDQFEYPLAVAAAVQNLLLAAWDREIGGVWLSLGLSPEAREILQIKEGYSVVAVLALGYFDAPPPAEPRVPVEQKLSHLP